MKAKIKATGEIVHVGDYNTIHHDPMYKNERTGPWRLEELDFTETPGYWTRLEHQYAGMAMQGLMTILPNIAGLEGRTPKDEIVDIAMETAHALVERLKEKEERR